MTECQFGCGTELIWDKNRKSDSGKMIPLEQSTNEPHNCPNSPYNKKREGQISNLQSGQQKLEGTPVGVNSEVVVILTDIQKDIIAIKERLLKLENQAP